MNMKISADGQVIATLTDVPEGSMARSLAGQMDTIGYLRIGTMNSNGTQDRELVVDPRKGVTAGDRTKVLRRGFDGIIPVVINDADDTITWNIEELLNFMNEGS